MSQADSQIGANKSGLTYRTEDNDGKKAILNHHKGAAAPSYAEAGMIWLDDSATPWLLKTYDGTDWITLGAINASTNIFTPYNGTAQIRELNYAADSGSANAYAIAPSPPITAYATGHLITLKPTNNQTSSCTVNVNSLGTKNIKLLDGSNPYSGAMVTTGVYWLMYDGTNFVLLNPSPLFPVLPYAADTGSADAYAIAPAPAIAAYAAGQTVTLKPANSNTGSSTINVNALGTKTIKLPDGNNLHANCMIAGGIYILQYDGTNFVLMNAEIGARINAQTGTTYTIVASDHGKLITCSNASAITVTVSNALKAGFYCTVAQKGAGQVTFSAQASGALRNRQSHTKIAGQYGMVSLFVEANAGTAPEIYLGGDTSS